MAASILASLVLRGPVLRDVVAVAVSLRLGSKSEANGRPAPAGMAISKRPMFGPWRQPDVLQGGDEPEVGNPTSGVTPGAGRSRRFLHGRLAAAVAPRGTTCWYPRQAYAGKRARALPAAVRQGLR